MSDPNSITFRGEPFVLAGTTPTLGNPIPDFNLTSWWNGTRIETSLDTLQAAGLPLLFSVVQSVDAPVSRLQAKNFDLRLAEFGGAVFGLQISSDLPLTLNRFLKNEEIYHLDGYSDYYDQNFGRSFGVLMEEPRVLARAVFVADWNGILHYAEVVPEITQEPDYESPINILRDLVVNAPGAQMEESVNNDSLPTES